MPDDPDIVYTAKCRVASEDTLTVEASPGAGEVFLLAARGVTGEDASVFLSPKKARRLAKAIKKAAKRAEADR